MRARRTGAWLVSAAAAVLLTACTSGSDGAPDAATRLADAEMQFGSAFVLRGLEPESTLAAVRDADTGVSTVRVLDVAVATVPDDVATPAATGSPTASPSGSDAGAAIAEAGLIACVVVGRTDGATPGTTPSWALAVTNGELYYWLPAADCGELARRARSAPTPTGSGGSPQVGRTGMPPGAIEVTDDSFARVALQIPTDQLTPDGAALVDVIREVTASKSAAGTPAATTNTGLPPVSSAVPAATAS